MSELIDTVILDEGFEKYLVGLPDESGFRLGPLGKINIFVGANNSGKSRLMRLLAMLNWLKQPFVPRFSQTNQFTNERPTLVARDFCRRIFNYPDQKSISSLGLKAEVSRIYADLTKLADQNKHTLDGQLQQRFFAFVYRLRHYPANTIKPEEFGMMSAQQELRNWAEAFIGQHRNKLEELRQKMPRTRLYIPTLRSLRHITGTDDFKKKTQEQYFSKSAPDHIFTGQTLYAEVENLLRGDLASREKLRRFESFLSETFFQSKSVALIPRKDQHELTIKIGEEEERPVHQLGDGIQSLILITFPLFYYSNEGLLAFIEEPEIFLHPWLQRVLLDVLEKRFSETSILSDDALKSSA